MKRVYGVLGLDAAWTERNPSGAALVTGRPGDWRCVWADAGPLDSMLRTDVDLIAVDMPIGRSPVVARRPCDNALTRAFVRNGLGVHTSSPERPGPVSHRLMEKLRKAGFDIATGPRKVIEVYPHAALLRLLHVNYRVPYKIARVRQYWPDATPVQRRELLCENLRRVLQALREKIGGIELAMPGPKPKDIKRFEDVLDGIVCAWVGTQYLEGNCEAFGDEDAAIWVPRA